MGTSLVRADFAAGFEAGHSRHVHVEQNQVGALGAEFFERFFADFALRSRRSPAT